MLVINGTRGTACLSQRSSLNMLRVKNADGLVSGHTLNVSRITNLRLV